VSYFSSLFQGGTVFYGDAFPPIINTIVDFGWGLLPQFPGYVRPPKGGGLPPVQQEQAPTVIAEVPVAVEPQTWGIEAETTWVPEVLPRPAVNGSSGVLTEVVIAEGVSTTVERFPEGDFLPGDIFRPGDVWGVSTDLDTAPDIQEESDVSVWGEIIDTVLGRQDWQLGGQVPAFDPWGPMYAGTAGVPMQRPSGRAALPPSAAPVTYTGGGGMGDCGNRRYVTLDRETGKISCKRRRRRRLLTNRDLADLASLKTITGGGAALNAAVIRAVR